MPSVTFIEFNGTEHTVAGEAGTSIMRLALDNGIPGIDGDCGGQRACATCRVIVGEAWRERVGPPVDDVEEALVDLAIAGQAGARLACQISLSDELDGVVIELPEAQF